ncbi:unnamed protein product [Brassica oleracea]
MNFYSLFYSFFHSSSGHQSEPLFCPELLYCLALFKEDRIALSHFDLFMAFSFLPHKENGPSQEVVLLLLLVSTFSIFQILFAQGAPTTLIPPIITFGNSVVNVGKNNYLSALLRAEYPTYGREFANLKSTARFCKGKLVTDITSNVVRGDCEPLWMQQVYAIGARKIGVTPLPQTGCLPAARNLFGFHEKSCVSRLHADAQQFNKKLYADVSKLQKQYSDLKIVVYDIFSPLYDLVQSPAKSGFSEAKKGCCGTRTVRDKFDFVQSKILRDMLQCYSVTQCVFWDNVHPFEAANEILAPALIGQGFSLLG